MPELGRTTPCAGCPWRTSSLRAYLGADEPVHFYWASITNENEMPCHEQIDYDNDPDWLINQLPNVDLCAGGLIHMRNSCKMPIQPKMAAAVRAVKPSKAVFGWPEEYMRHHMPGATPEEIKAATLRALNRWDEEFARRSTERE